MSVSAAAIRSASTGKQTLANGLKASGTISQFSEYMYGNTACSNLGASKKVVNTYYYYIGGNLKSETEGSSYVTNGFEGYTYTTNFVSKASGNVVGIKGQHYVNSSSTLIWSDTCWSGTIN